MNHSPAEIVRQLLIDEGVGSDGGTWPVYSTNEPATPDNCITVYDTAGTSSGRAMIDGELLGYFGFQVRIRAKTHTIGWLKAYAVQFALVGVYQKTVHIGSDTYFVHCIARIKDIMVLGKEPTGKRSLFTVNALVPINQTQEI